MAASLLLGSLAIAGVSAQEWNAWGANPTASEEPNVNTATSPAAVYAAQATAATYTGSTPYVRGAVFDRFINIWLENTDYATAAGDADLAWLATQGITLSKFYGVTHPSEPNYAAAIGGDNFGMDNDQFNQIGENVSYVASIVDLLEDRGISWGSYEEDMPYTGYEGFSWVNQKTKANDYVRKHNPPILYNANTSPRRLSYQKNTTEFYKDLAAERLPQWIFVTPNMTSDGHDTNVQVAGAWTRGFLEPLLSNSYFMERTLILITFDENHSYSIGNNVFSILLGGAVPKSLHGTTDDHYYNHYSEIATVEANWNLHTLGRWDVGANVFKLVADVTGDIYRGWEALTGPNPTVFLNSSFAGPFNSEFETAPYPVPNIFLLSPGFIKRTVLPSIVETWGALSNQFSKYNYYNDGVEIPDGQHPPAGYAYNDVNN